MTPIDICNRAFLKLGAAGLSSFEDGTAEAQLATGLYEATRDALLSSYPWSFATAQASLAKLASTPLVDFDHAYQLPSDFLRALSVGSGAGLKGRGVGYRLQEDRLHTNQDGVVLTYVFRPNEAGFPAFFAEALATRLAAEFVLPLTESTSRAELMHQLADRATRAARLTDAQQQTPTQIDDFALVDVRG